MTDSHDHEHGPACGHTAVGHEGRILYLHDGESHHHAGDSVESHTIAVSDANPAECTSGHDCDEHQPGHQHGLGCGHEAVPHGDHVDYLVGGHLHHPHVDHCDHHGTIEVVSHG